MFRKNFKKLQKHIYIKNFKFNLCQEVAIVFSNALRNIVTTQYLILMLKYRKSLFSCFPISSSRSSSSSSSSQHFHRPLRLSHLLLLLHNTSSFLSVSLSSSSPPLSLMFSPPPFFVKVDMTPYRNATKQIW